MNVYQKLNEARARFHSSAIKKSGHNKFAGYDYFELSDFVVPAVQIFREVGLIGMVSFDKDSAQLTVVNVDKPDEQIVFRSPMSEANLKGCHPVQNLGAVETYIRRYLWVVALEIVEHDALDATTGHDAPKKIVHRPVEGAVIPEDAKPYLQELAQDLIHVIKEQRKLTDGMAMLHAAGLEPEQKIYLWSLLPSEVRSQIKTAEKTPI